MDSVRASGRSYFRQMKMVFWVLLFAATATTSLAQEERTGIEIKCTFTHRTASDGELSAISSPNDAIALSSSETLIASRDVSQEIVVGGNARHFVLVLPAGVLRAQTLTVMNDGAAVRTQHYATPGKKLGVAAHVEIGNCEIME